MLHSISSICTQPKLRALLAQNQKRLRQYLSKPSDVYNQKSIHLHGIDVVKISSILPIYALEAPYPDVEIKEHSGLVSTLESIADKEGEIGVVLEEIKKEIGLHGYRSSEGAKSLMEEGIKELDYTGSLQLGPGFYVAIGPERESVAKSFIHWTNSGGLLLVKSNNFLNQSGLLIPRSLQWPRPHEVQDFVNKFGKFDYIASSLSTGSEAPGLQQQAVFHKSAFPHLSMTFYDASEVGKKEALNRYKEKLDAITGTK